MGAGGHQAAFFHGKLIVRHMKTVLEGKLAGVLLDFFLKNTLVFQELPRDFGKVSWSDHVVWFPCAASLAGCAETDMTYPWFSSASGKLQKLGSQ